MTVYAAFDDSEETTQLATTYGWGDLKRWVSSLPAGQFLDLRHLCRYGWDQDLEQVRSQLLTARLQHRPSSDVLSTVTNLLEMLSDLKGKDRITIVG